MALLLSSQSKVYSDLINTVNKQSPRPIVPQGKMPQLAAENDKVDLTMVSIQVKLSLNAIRKSKGTLKILGS